MIKIVTVVIDVAAAALVKMIPLMSVVPYSSHDFCDQYQMVMQLWLTF